MIYSVVDAIIMSQEQCCTI